MWDKLSFIPICQQNIKRAIYFRKKKVKSEKKEIVGKSEIMMLLRRSVGYISKLRVLNGNFDSKISSISRCSNGNFSTKSPPSTWPVLEASGGAAELAAADHLLLDCSLVSAAKSPLEPTILQPGVVIYDGVCHLCHKGVKWVIEADKEKKIKFCCLQSKAAEPYMRVSGVDREDVLRRFLFVEGPGLYHQGSTAALRVMSYLPLPYSALSTLMIVPRHLRDAVYDYVAKRRHEWFGKSADCLVLKEKELLERFVDWEELLARSSQNYD